MEIRARHFCFIKLAYFSKIDDKSDHIIWTGDDDQYIVELKDLLRWICRKMRIV